MSFHRRTLDPKRGALITESRISSPAGLAVRLRVLRLVSLCERALGLQLVQMDIDAGAVEATVKASVDRLKFGLRIERLEHDLCVWRTSSSGKRLALAVAASLWVDGVLLAPRRLSPFKDTWTWLTHPGQSVHFERIFAVTREDAPAGDPGADAHGKLAAAPALRWRAVLHEHEARWAARWHESDVGSAATRLPGRRCGSPCIT